MKLKFYSILLLIIIQSSVFAQTPLPYYTGFDNSTQQAGWQEYRKGDQSHGSWGLASFNAFTAPNALTHSYPVGGTIPTDDWYVSPMFDFSNGGKIDSIRHSFGGFGIPGSGDTISLFLLTGSQDPALASSKILLNDYTINYANDNTWHLDTGINIPPTSGQSYIAFKYTTVINWLDVSFDNISVSGNSPTGFNDVSDVSNKSIVYPNPAGDFIKISNNISGSTVITNSEGKIIKTISSLKFQNEMIDVSDLPEGIYLLKTIRNNNQLINKFIKLR